MRAIVLALIIVAITGAVRSSARQPILEIDNPWSGHHIAVTSVKPGMVGALRREGLTIEFEITPPSGDRSMLIKDFVTVWQAMKAQVDASGFDAVTMTAPNAAADAAATFTKRSGEWFIFSPWGWTPPESIRPMIRDFGPLQAYTLRSSEPSLAYWNASAMLLSNWTKPHDIKPGDTQLAVTIFPNPLDGRSSWLTHDTCDSIEKRGIRFGRRLDPSDPYTAVTTLHVDWQLIEGAGYTAAVLDRTGYVDWCGALSRSNRAVSHVLP